MDDHVKGLFLLCFSPETTTNEEFGFGNVSLSVPDALGSESDSDAEDVLLSFQREVTDTVATLQPFEATQRPRRGGRRRREQPSGGAESDGPRAEEGTGSPQRGRGWWWLRVSGRDGHGNEVLEFDGGDWK